MSDQAAGGIASGPFLLDAMLGKLAVYLRMCGHDAAYALDRDVEADDAVLAWADDEHRTLVTRDVALAERADESILLQSREVEAQLRELADAGVALAPPAQPSRCGACNGELAAVPATGTTAAYAPDPHERDVWRCRDCGRYFWRGSHWDRVEETLSRL